MNVLNVFKSKKQIYKENTTPKFSIGDEVRVREYETGNQYFSKVESIHVRQNGSGEFFYVYGIKDLNGFSDFLQQTELKHKQNYIHNGW